MAARQGAPPDLAPGAAGTGIGSGELATGVLRRVDKEVVT
jgi:hypothetical protein